VADTKLTAETAVMDRRSLQNRRAEDNTDESGAEPCKTERRAKVNRRRQIDPTTCERDYTNDEIEFMQALDAYKRSSGRMFPTCSEILEVIRDLGYQKAKEQATAEQTDEATPEQTPAILAAPMPGTLEAAVQTPIV